MKFSDLGLSEPVLKAVAEAGYETPTPIQAQTIPFVLQGRDVLGTAQTGTGKTAGFTLPLIDALSGGRARARMPRALIVEPTRELADQVAENFAKYGKYSKLSFALLIGGVSFGDQEKKLDRGVDVLIATPGRLLDHFGRGGVMLGGVQVLVIDEADRMMDMGFMPDVEKIVKLLPPLRQTLFFSATMPPEMRKLADIFLTNPKEVSVAAPSSTSENVVQALVMVEPRKKHDALVSLITSEKVTNAIVFCNRKRDVDLLHKSLVKRGLNAGALHGDLAQSIRMETLDKFKRNEIAILVASDVAARGLDVKGLSHVFNFDVPIHAEDYVHRIGRTGRAGLTGHAFTLASGSDDKFVNAIEKMTSKKIPVVNLGIGNAAAAPAEATEIELVSGMDEAAEQPEVAGLADEQPSAPKRERKPRERKPRERKPRGAKREAVTVDPVAAPPPAVAEVVELPVRERALRRERQPRREHERDDADSPVMAFGDHMPAFLMRPARRQG